MKKILGADFKKNPFGCLIVFKIRSQVLYLTLHIHSLVNLENLKVDSQETY